MQQTLKTATWVAFSPISSVNVKNVPLFFSQLRFDQGAEEPMTTQKAFFNELQIIIMHMNKRD